MRPGLCSLSVLFPSLSLHWNSLCKSCMYKRKVQSKSKPHEIMCVIKKTLSLLGKKIFQKIFMQVFQLKLQKKLFCIVQYFKSHCQTLFLLSSQMHLFQHLKLKIPKLDFWEITWFAGNLGCTFCAKSGNYCIMWKRKKKRTLTDITCINTFVY